MLKALPRPAAVSDVSVCIVNWNGREMLGDCLESLLRQPQGVRVDDIKATMTDGVLLVTAPATDAEEAHA